MVTAERFEPQAKPEEITTEEVKDLLSGNDTHVVHSRPSLRLSAGSMPLAAADDPYRHHEPVDLDVYIQERFGYLQKYLDKSSVNYQTTK